MSNELNGEMQAVVQRSLTVPSQRVDDDIAHSALLLSYLCVIELWFHQELDGPFVFLLCRHRVDPEERGRTTRGWKGGVGCWRDRAKAKVCYF